MPPPNATILVESAPDPDPVPSDPVPEPPLKRKAGRGERAYHRKVKTGCSTCKTRKIRCDEQKPACHRCASTGRTCGYLTMQDGSSQADASAPASASHSSTSSAKSTSPPLAVNVDELLRPLHEFKLLLPRRNPHELRAYRYFLDVAAPALAGAFHSEFWMQDIIRASNADAAVWHAIISLGTVYECYASQLIAHEAQSNRVFALEQFSLSVRCLVEQSAREADRWRALAISAIFTCLCNIQGATAQAITHIKSGMKLLRELERDDEEEKRKRSASPAEMYWGCRPLPPTTPPLRIDSSSMPVSLTAIKSLLVSLDTMASAHENGGLLATPELIAENETFHVWRHYVAPRVDDPAMEFKPLMTDEALWQANRAAESIQNGIIWVAQQSAHMAVEGMKTGHRPEAMMARQKPLVEAYKEINKAISIFEEEMEATSTRERPPKAFLTLLLFQIFNRTSLYRDPDMPDQEERKRALQCHFVHILDLAEEIFRLEDEQRGPRKHTPTPTPSITGPLSLVAAIGSSLKVRRRAVALLRQYPRHDGEMDSLLYASLAEVCMAREKEVRWENRSVDPRRLESEIDSDEEYETASRLDRICNTSAADAGERSCVVTLYTWRERDAGLPGVQRVMRW